MYEHVNDEKNKFGNDFWWSVDADFFVFFGEAKKELINYFVNGCYEKDDGKKLIKQKISKCRYIIK